MRLNCSVTKSMKIIADEMPMTAAVIILMLACVISVTGKAPPEKCEREWYKIGCYHDRIFPNRPYPHELVNHRDPLNRHWDGHLLDWKEWPQSLHALACKCAELTRKLNYEYFGLKFYGECWSGANLKYYRDGGSNKCIGIDFKSCNDSSQTECVGKPFTNYIYKLKEVEVELKVDGGWSEWFSWSPCSASCDGGKRVRERVCNNPKSNTAGKDCEGPSKSEEVCNTEECEPECEQKLEIAMILDGSTSVTRKNWNKTMDFVNIFSRVFSISPNNVHFGIITFSWFPRISFTISDKRYWQREAFERKTSSIRYTYGGTRIDLAIKEAEEKFMCSTCGLRPGVHKVIIVLTDGKSGAQSTPMEIATKKLKADGVTFIAIGVGNHVAYDQLVAIAKDEQHVFHVSEYKYLVDAMNKVLKAACEKEQEI